MLNLKIKNATIFFSLIFDTTKHEFTLVSILIFTQNTFHKKLLVYDKI
jgi:hypothetical protein